MSDVAGTLTPPGLPLRDPPRVAASYGISLNDPVFGILSGSLPCENPRSETFAGSAGSAGSAETAPLPFESHARKMRTFFTRRLEPKTRSSCHIKRSNAK